MALIDLCSTEPTQTIKLIGEDEDRCVEVYGKEVIVVGTGGVGRRDHSASSKLKINNIVDYCWEEKFYLGQLLALHKEGKYIAYAIKAMSKTQSVVRILNRETSKRSLIKDINGVIEDLAFADTFDQVLLASVDNAGTLLVHNITETSDEITCTLMLHILQTGEVSGPHRVVWCSYITEEESEGEVDDFYDEISRLLAVTRDNKIELWNVKIVSETCGCGPWRGGEVEDGYLEIEAHSKLIVDAAFSPDGSAIATASLDGHCKFYQISQVYRHSEGTARCLHQWEPHAGKPLSSVFFLDDHRNYIPCAQFWKFAVTGAENNTELKLWSCETWQCLQTIRFAHMSPPLKLKASMDAEAGFILLSDMINRVLYVLELKKYKKETYPFVCSLSEFKLPYPILSFAIVDAGHRLFKTNTPFALEDLSNGGEVDEEGGGSAVVVRMYLVQPKSLQECNIVFQPPRLHKNEKPNEVTSGNSLPISLMTPDAFSSPAKHDSSTGRADSTEFQPTSPDPITTQREVGSGGSSPSREVQEILSVQQSPCLYFQEITDWAPPIRTEADSGGNVGVTEVSTQTSSDDEMKRSLATIMVKLDSQSRLIQELRDEVQSGEERLRELVEDKVEKVRAEVVERGANLRCSLDSVALAAHLTQAVTSSLSTSIMQQLHSIVKPSIVTRLDELRDKMEAELVKKLSSSDVIVKESLNKMVKNKAMIESITNTLLSNVTPAMQECYKATFSKTVPVFERSCDTMFQQIINTFSKGTEEYIKEMEAFSQKANARTEREVGALISVSEAINLSAQQLVSNIEKAGKRLEDRLEERLALDRRSLNGGGVRSRSVTPAGHLLDSALVQEDLVRLISEGQYNQAFQQALSASDLSLVMFLCSRASPHTVFASSGCLLQQHVLLSLIQQLSADMSSHNDIKHRYLEEAVMNLDACNVATREHMPSVLGSLSKQLHHFVATHPTSPLTKRVRILQMATQSLLSY